MVEVLGKIEILIGQARARIAAHDARQSRQLAPIEDQTRAPVPLPSLTSAFATRREIFGPVSTEDADD